MLVDLLDIITKDILKIESSLEEAGVLFDFTFPSENEEELRWDYKKGKILYWENTQGTKELLNCSIDVRYSNHKKLSEFISSLYLQVNRIREITSVYECHNLIMKQLNQFPKKDIAKNLEDEKYGK